MGPSGGVDEEGEDSGQHIGAHLPGQTVPVKHGVHTVVHAQRAVGVRDRGEQLEGVGDAAASRGPGPVDEAHLPLCGEQDVVRAHVGMAQRVPVERADAPPRRLAQLVEPLGDPRVEIRRRILGDPVEAEHVGAERLRDAAQARDGARGGRGLQLVERCEHPIELRRGPGLGREDPGRHLGDQHEPVLVVEGRDQRRDRGGGGDGRERGGLGTVQGHRTGIVALAHRLDEEPTPGLRAKDLGAARRETSATGLRGHHGSAEQLLEARTERVGEVGPGQPVRHGHTLPRGRPDGTGFSAGTLGACASEQPPSSSATGRCW